MSCCSKTTPSFACSSVLRSGTDLLAPADHRPLGQVPGALACVPAAPRCRGFTFCLCFDLQSDLQLSLCHAYTVLCYTFVYVFVPHLYGGVQCRIVLYIVVRRRAVSYMAVHCCTLLYIVVHCGTLLYIAVHCCTMLYMAVHC